MDSSSILAFMSVHSFVVARGKPTARPCTSAVVGFNTASLYRPLTHLIFPFYVDSSLKPLIIWPYQTAQLAVFLQKMDGDGRVVDSCTAALSIAKTCRVPATQIVPNLNSTAGVLFRLDSNRVLQGIDKWTRLKAAICLSPVRGVASLKRCERVDAGTITYARSCLSEPCRTFPDQMGQIPRLSRLCFVQLVRPSQSVPRSRDGRLRPDSSHSMSSRREWRPARAAVIDSRGIPRRIRYRARSQTSATRQLCKSQRRQPA